MFLIDEIASNQKWVADFKSNYLNYVCIGDSFLKEYQTTDNKNEVI